MRGSRGERAPATTAARQGMGGCNQSRASLRQFPKGDDWGSWKASGLSGPSKGKHPEGKGKNLKGKSSEGKGIYIPKLLQLT